MSFHTWESYFYPDTEVLRNRAGLRDADTLREFEEEAVFLRTSEILVQNPVPGNLDRAHLCAIHQRVFGDVYDWAGQERTAPAFPMRMSKNGASLQAIAEGRYDAPADYSYDYFPAGDGMVEHFDLWIRRLHAGGDYASMNANELAASIAEPWGELNVAHLFREGNTRTQVAFFTYFARHHGHELDYTRFTDPRFRLKFNAGRFMIQAAKGEDLLVQVLSEVIDPEPGRQMVFERPGDTDVPDDYQPHYESKVPRNGP